MLFFGRDVDRRGPILLGPLGTEETEKGAVAACSQKKTKFKAGQYETKETTENVAVASVVAGLKTRTRLRWRRGKRRRTRENPLPPALRRKNRPPRRAKSRAWRP